MRPQETIQKAIAAQRRGLLAKAHCGKRDLCLTEEEWDAIRRGFKVDSFADMTIRQLENLVKYLEKGLGWKPLRTKRYRARTADDWALQAAALKDRVEDEIATVKNGQERLPGLVQKICGVDALIWCRDPRKLERLLAVIGKIKEREG